MIAVLFFGPVADRTGCARLEVEHRAGLTLGQLRSELAARFPEAFELVSMSAVDGVRRADPELELDDRSEVVFMSSFSGG